MQYGLSRRLFGPIFVFAAATSSLARAEDTKTPPDHALTLESVNAAAPLANRPLELVDPLLIRAQVLLDRADASPGVIDGRAGDNMKKALLVFEQVRNLPQAPDLSAPVWQALVKDDRPALTVYEITPEDLKGPFAPDIPTDYGEMAKLPNLAYRGPTQMFGARFHMDTRLLTALNPNVDFSKAGTRITVAAVARTPSSDKIASIAVDKTHGQVQALDSAGHLIVAYPATIGSTETPSPSGSYKVKGVAWNPVYIYDPQKNFKQGSNNHKLKIPAGPNNPVGSVFIALTKPTYGIHGTPDPDKIDKTVSHGCVRLTNWDAEELAHMVKPGVKVSFVD